MSNKMTPAQRAALDAYNETGSFTAAAEKLGKTRQTVTAQVKTAQAIEATPAPQSVMGRLVAAVARGLTGKAKARARKGKERRQGRIADNAAGRLVLSFMYGNGAGRSNPEPGLGVLKASARHFAKLEANKKIPDGSVMTRQRRRADERTSAKIERSNRKADAQRSRVFGGAAAVA